MKKMLIVIMIIFSPCGIAIASSEEKNILERSVGKLLLSHNQKFSYQNDLNPFGSAILYDEFKKIFDNEIIELPVEDRINFFWFAMWHLSFDGHVMMQFEKLVEKDCGDQFIVRLKKYIETESKLKRSKSRLHLSKQVLIGIKGIRVAREKYNLE